MVHACMDHIIATTQAILSILHVLGAVVKMLPRPLLAQVLMLCSTVAQNVLYVKPSIDPAVVCPGQPCLTLGQYAEMSDRYFTTGSTFVFLAGNHSLHTVLSLANVSDTTLRGPGNSSTARIFFSNNATIRCENVGSFLIDGLKFKSATLRMNRCDYKILNCVFQGSGNMYAQFCNITVHDCLFEGNAGLGRSLKIWRNSNLTLAGSTFTGSSGGAIAATLSAVNLEGRNVFRFNSGSTNSAVGALKCLSCTLTMSGTSIFEHNGFRESRFEGGALSVHSGKLAFGPGTVVVFSHNTGFYGGAMTLSNSQVHCESGASILFDGNMAWYGGAIHMVESFFQPSKCTMNFVNNIARKGGGVYISSLSWDLGHKDPIILSANFTNNSATRCGGALSFESVRTSIELRDTNITNNSQNAVCVSNSKVTFKATRLLHNSGNFNEGGSIYSVNSSLLFMDNILFEGNTARSGGGAVCLLEGSALFLGVAVFTNNSAGRDGGGLHATSAVIDLHGTVALTSNSAQNGGAIFLEGSSIKLGNNTTFNSSFNRAGGYGGGIYYVDRPDPVQCYYKDDSKVPNCFLHLIGAPSNNSLITSYCDSAGIDGSFLFGGLLDRCRVREDFAQTFYQLMTDSEPDTILNITSGSNITQAITSHSYGLCFCDDPYHSLDCSGARIIKVRRGQKFTVPMVAIAQGSSVTSTSVTAITSPSASLKLPQSMQHLPQYCSNLTYNIYSTMEEEKVMLYPEGPCQDTGNAFVMLYLLILACPDGFSPVPDGNCICDKRLHQFGVLCEDSTFIKKSGMNFWMGVEYNADSIYEGLILYKTCPVEYCRTDEVNMTLSDLDTQCVEGRIGVLCGGCAENYSLLIGSSKCKECSNTYLVLLLPFAAAGIALVAFLSILRLTVATGMINSLILYANIVQVNRKLFFPANTVNILTVFIAWLNLDLGFEICFYDGMDAFAQTCLQFAFPVYVWVLISLIILTSRYSITVSKLIGHNPIAVLATLLLMSYTKVLKIFIEVYSSVKLDYPQSKTVTVWLKDANVPYLRSKHLALTVLTSLVLIFLFLPYTLLLLLGHKLYRLSGRKHFHWLNNLKPLLDSYYAPYKIHARYWTGFLLLVRCVLYIVFSLGGTEESLLAIIISFTAVGFAVGFVHRGRIYKNLNINILEASVYLNLVSISAVTAQLIYNTRTGLAYCLVGIILITTIGIIIHHFHVLYTAKSVMWLKLKALILYEFRSSKPAADNDLATVTSSHDPHKMVSRTVIELREPLLEDQ